MERLFTRMYPITKKPDGMDETHVRLYVNHTGAAANEYERKSGFVVIATVVKLDNDGFINYIYDSGINKPHMRIFIPKRNTENNRKQVISKESISEYVVRTILHCHDFGVDFDPQNFLPCGLD